MIGQPEYTHCVTELECGHSQLRVTRYIYDDAWCDSCRQMRLIVDVKTEDQVLDALCV